MRPLPIRTRRVLGEGGRRGVTLTVFCPRRTASLPLDVCAECPRLGGIDLEGDAPVVRCAPGVDEAPAMIGALVRPAVICVEEHAELRSVDGPLAAETVVPVVDARDRYIGAIVRGRAPTQRAPRDLAEAVLRGRLDACDVMDHLPPVHERDGLVDAAASMIASRSRSVVVVDANRVVVGVLDDLALLRAFARGHA